MRDYLAAQETLVLRAIKPRKRRIPFIVLALLSVTLVSSLGIAALTLYHARDTYQSSAFTPPLVSPGGQQILGISSNGADAYPGIPWLRLSYKTCGNSDFSGSILKNLIAAYHRHDIHILLLICQQEPKHLLDTGYIADAASAKADAYQCGNEEMKDNSLNVRYVPPGQYAAFFALCEHAIHVPVLMGSLDPQIAGVDTNALIAQENYLDNVQLAMNTVIDPGGNWTWQAHMIGLNDSAHNGYPSSSDNNLYQLFAFWSQAFEVPLDQLHTHLWIVEGTACYQCGDRNDAVSHVITMITDVLTATQYHIAFFYFNGRDFVLEGMRRPFGILDLHGHPKPLTKRLMMLCKSGKVGIDEQEQLLASLYQGCRLPANYAAILEN